MGYKIFLDIDLSNAFHQFRLSEASSRLLAIQTPWKLVQPKYLPEGVSPASGHLQTTMIQMFGDFREWAIVIFDNILLLAHDENDAGEKLLKFLERCAKHNVYLKPSKSWIGYPSVKFFGYLVSYGKYQMDDDRKKAIGETPMPKNQKGMQSFLGAALFFKSFVPNFSDLAGPLYDMTRKGFNWDEKTWTKDYVKHFNEMKEALMSSMANYFPDYSLPWILRVDASDYAVGCVLYQIRTLDNGTEVYEPIAFASKKFSEVAKRWDTIKKEAYACYFGVSHFSYYLRGVSFVLETDHKNLLYIEKSEVPIIIRWRVYLQSFTIRLRHIAGTKNIVADWLSRMNAYMEEVRLFNLMNEYHADVSCLLGSMIEVNYEEELLCNIDQTWSEPESNTLQVTEQGKKWSPEEMFAEVHGGRHFHQGVRRTWLKLNQRFPGHRIRYDQLEDMVGRCAICQKDRLRMVDYIEPVNRHLKPTHARSRVGVDNLTVTPEDEFGRSHLIE
jgi:hypothetical protein